MLYGSDSMASTPHYMRGRTPETHRQWQSRTDTPQKLARFLSEHMHMRYGPTDGTPQSPLETYLRGDGNDLDLAVMGGNWLSTHGYQTKVLAVENQGSLRALLAIREKDSWSYLHPNLSMEGGVGPSDGFNSLDEAFPTDPHPLASREEPSSLPTYKTGFRTLPELVDHAFGPGNSYRVISPAKEDPIRRQ